MVLSTARRVVVLGGAGAIGCIVVRDLFTSNRRNEILVADYNPDAALSLAKEYRSRRVSSASADARNVIQLSALLRGYSVVVNCTRHQFNLNVMEAAVRARAHYVDLGGLFTWTRRQLKFSRQFARAGLTAVLGMGCAPGLTNVMAAAAGSQLHRVDSIRIRVGSKDFNAGNNDFVFPYSAQTIIEELTLPSWKWSAGRFVQSKPRQGWEVIDFGPPVGRVSVVMTRHSEIATLPLRLKRKGLRYADFKVSFDRSFVQEVMKRLRAGWSVKDFEALPASRSAPNDYEISRVTIKGGKQTIAMECHARSNAEWHASAGDIDTACPASIAAQMIIAGTVRKPGVWPPEEIIPANLLFAECEKRGMKFVYLTGAGAATSQ
jgi:saccharopine dehydrogenase-like NADP-dependent oxidoreductase